MIRNRMKEFRARTGMKQEELAARVGVRRETIGNPRTASTIRPWSWPEHRQGVRK